MNNNMYFFFFNIDCAYNNNIILYQNNYSTMALLYIIIGIQQVPIPIFPIGPQVCVGTLY